MKIEYKNARIAQNKILYQSVIMREYHFIVFLQDVTFQLSDNAGPFTLERELFFITVGSI